MTTLPLVLSVLWIVAASLAGMLHERRDHGPLATALIATGVPLLGLVTWQLGPVAGLLAFGAGISLLRWPLRLHLPRPRRTGRVAAPAAEREAQPAE